MGARRVPAIARASGIALLVAFTFGTTAVQAQRGPVFELQPGLAISDFISVAEGTLANTAFSLRFATRFPTALRWLTPVAGALFTPYGSTQNTVRNTDAPTVFVGNIFSLIPESRTRGLLSIEVPLLVAHSPGTGPTGNVRDYGRDLVIVPTVYLHVGAGALREFGAVWSRLKIVGQLEQNLTPNKAPDTGHRDFFNPIATIGLSLTIGAPSN